MTPAASYLAVALCLALVAGCAREPKPDARYPESLTPCELLPPESAAKVLDVGAELGPAQPKVSRFIVEKPYCLWKYKQKKKHFWEVRPGPVERSLTVSVEVFNADENGAIGAKAFLEASPVAGQQTLTGLGDAAIWSTDRSNWSIGRIKFQRSNAVVTVTLTGHDWVERTHKGRDIEAAKLRQMVTKTARAIDLQLQSR